MEPVRLTSCNSSSKPTGWVKWHGWENSNEHYYLLSSCDVNTPNSNDCVSYDFTKWGVYEGCSGKWISENVSCVDAMNTYLSKTNNKSGCTDPATFCDNVKNSSGRNAPSIDKPQAGCCDWSNQSDTDAKCDGYATCFCVQSGSLQWNNCCGCCSDTPSDQNGNQTGNSRCNDDDQLTKFEQCIDNQYACSYLSC